MPAIAAAPLFYGAVAGAGISAGASLIGGKMQSNAANKAGDLQSKSNADALAFEKEQAKQDQERFEQTQQMNYGQYLNRYHAAQGLGHSIGFDLPDAPAYPSANGSSGQPAQGGGGAEAFIKQWQATHPASEGTGPLMAALKANGFNASPYMYGQQQSGNEISLNGEKYKVGIDDGRGGLKGWYAAGTNDGPPARLASSVGSYLPGGPALPRLTQDQFKLRGVSAFL